MKNDTEQLVKTIYQPILFDNYGYEVYFVLLLRYYNQVMYFTIRH